MGLEYEVFYLASRLITEVLLYGKFMGTFCSQTLIYFSYLHASCVCDAQATGAYVHTRSSSAIQAELWEVSSQLSLLPSVSTYKQTVRCINMKNRYFLQSCVVGWVEKVEQFHCECLLGI